MSVGAVMFLYLVPVLFTTLIFRHSPSKRSTAYVWGIGVNCAAIVLVCLLLRHTVGIERAGFVVLWWIWSLATAAAACLAGDVCDEVAALWRRHRRGVLLGLATVAAGIVLFAPEQFLQVRWLRTAAAAGAAAPGALSAAAASLIVPRHRSILSRVRLRGKQPRAPPTLRLGLVRVI